MAECRLERYQTSEANPSVFCLQEGVSRSTYYRWKRRLENGISESLETESEKRQQIDANESLSLPISLKASRVEVELPVAFAQRHQ